MLCRKILLFLLPLTITINIETKTKVSAFPIPAPVVPIGSQGIASKKQSSSSSSVSGGSKQKYIPRGGMSTSNSQLNESTSGSAAPAPPIKRIRLTALDGIRFLLCIHIVLGHFLRFANPSEFWIKFFAQINITVGAFFALSGYVTAYTTTEVGRYAASAKLVDTPSQKWWLSKSMSYFPMHWLVLLLFSPVFLYADVNANGWPTTILHGILSATLTQAWFPMTAEVWNSPTWFLSSLTFVTALLPFSIPKIATMDKRSLRKTAGWLFLIKLLPVLGHVYDNKVWSLVEGITAPKANPAYSAFNVQRFNPLFNVAEVLLGVVACRLVMLDSLDESKDKPTTNKSNWLSTAVPLAGLVGILASRAAGIVPDCSDLLVRSIIFTPLFLKFVMGCHRNAVSNANDPVSKVLSAKPLVWLGGLTFPIYIVHGPIGQIFYKRIIAGKLWGGVLKGPQYFGLYLTSVFIAALLLQRLFLQNTAVKNWSKKKVDQLASWM